MKKLLTPRGYLSWSQISLWQRNRFAYIQQYFYGEVGQKSEAMDFGSKAASAMETGKETDDEMLNLLMATLPRYNCPEHKLRATVKTDAGEVDILGSLDTFDDKTFKFREYKTGVIPWSQRRAQGHRQLDHYAALIWLTHNVVPPEVHLDWAQTQKLDDGSVALTGVVKSFAVKKSLSDILNYLAEVSKVAREIDEAYRAQMKKLS